MDPFIGQIQEFGFNFAPNGWAHCNGQLISIAQNTALFSLIGTIYGGDGQTTFALPDLRGRSIVHPGQGPGLSNIVIGQSGGTETKTVLIANLPSHHHNVSVAVNSSLGEEADPTTFIAAKASSFSESPTSGATLGGLTQSAIGGNQPINNREPYLGIYYSIALYGIFPSRN